MTKVKKIEKLPRNNNLEILDDSPESFEISIETESLADLVKAITDCLKISSLPVAFTGLLSDFKKFCKSVSSSRSMTTLEQIESIFTVKLSEDSVIWSFTGEGTFSVEDNYDNDEDEICEDDFSIAIETFRNWESTMTDYGSSHIVECIDNYNLSDGTFSFEVEGNFLINTKLLDFFGNLD